jgi:hypothetical protein
LKSPKKQHGIELFFNVNCFMRSTALLLIIFCILFIYACKKNDVADPCKGIDIAMQINKTEAIGTANNGSITIVAPRGDSITYKLNNGIFQDYPIFSSLAPGSYVVTVKNKQGCTDTANITILNYGPKYALVKQIILGYCGPCHLNGSTSGGRNYDTDANIVAAKDRIKVRAVDGVPTYMPEGGQLTTVDKQKITDWINAGGRTTD